MPVGSDICPCDWDADFGEQSCDPQVPGADDCMVAVCLNKFETITKTAADDTNSCSTGVITDTTLLAGEKGYRIVAISDSINPNSSETLNDNNGKDIDENVVFQGALTTCNINWLRAHFGREVALFFKDNDGKLWCIGWDGGFKINTFNNQWGQQQGDFKGVDVTMSNTSKSPVCEVIPTTGTVDDFLAGLIA